MNARSSFPVKLHACLTELEHTEQSHIASFQPHGRALMVHQPDDFMVIVPRWFNLTKIESFQRQLNIYGFQRITTGPDQHAYYHPLVQRGHAAMAARIPRWGPKGIAGSRQAVECCPDFVSAFHPEASNADTAASLPFVPTAPVPTNRGMIDPPDPTTRPSLSQMVLHRAAMQAMVHPVTASNRFLSPPNHAMTGGLWTVSIHVQWPIPPPHPLDWAVYLRPQPTPEQRLRERHLVQQFLAGGAAPQLPRAADVWLPAALGQAQRGQELALAQSFLERYHAMNTFALHQLD